jgi:ATP-dependent Lhr-like helicase
MTVPVPAPPSQTSASTLELVEKHNDDVCQPRTLEKSEQPTATFCSSTLEMGIDVGNVKLVGQIGAPCSVSSLTQRLGRSGRKEGETSVIRIYIAEDEPVQNTSLFDRLFLKLLQATAMTELMREKWCEPPEVDRLHLSTLIQQVLSVITERSGSRADDLHRTLVLQGGFPNVDQPMLIDMLRCMGAADLIEQTPEGLLISGLLGEKLARSHDFYVAFIVHEEYRVNHEGHHIGNIAFVPEFQEGKFLIFAGRRSQILHIDHERMAITVQPSPGGRVPGFHGERGQDIHPRVRQAKKDLLKQPICQCTST